MRILGVDPGYRNLGLALLDINEEQRIVTPLWSGSLSVGTADNGLNYVKFLWPKLNEIYAEHGCDGVASETPPFIMRQIKPPEHDHSNAMVREFRDFLLGLHERLELPPRCPDDIEESSLPSIREKIREEESAEEE